MIKIVSPDELVWKRIKANENVIEFIEQVNKFLEGYDGKIINNIQLKVEMEKKFSIEEIELITFAFSQFGWDITFSYNYFGGNYILGSFLSIKK